MKIKLHVKEIREKNFISQIKLATESNISVRQLRRIEKNQNIPNCQTLQQIAKALGTTPDKLLE